jgi:integrase
MKVVERRRIELPTFALRRGKYASKVAAYSVLGEDLGKIWNRAPMAKTKIQCVYDRPDRSTWQVKISRKDAAGRLHKITRSFPYDRAVPAGHPHSRSKARDDAAAFATKERAALRIEKRPAPELVSAQTLGGWLSEYQRDQFDEPPPGRRRKKGEEQERSVINSLRGQFPDLLAKPASDLTALDFHSALGLVGRMERAGYKTNTIIRYFALLSAVWREYGKPRGLMKPFDTKNLKREDDSRERIISDSEFSQILGAMIQCAAATRAAILFLRWTAARRGEAVKLQWSDLVKAERGTGLALLRDTKSPKRGKVKNRTVPVPRLVMEAIAKLPRDTATVFGCRGDSLTNAWDKSCKRAGIQDARLHDLRHTRITELVDGGMNILELAALTGHDDLRMLQRYYNPKPEALARAAAASDRVNAARKRQRKKVN